MTQPVMSEYWDLIAEVARLQGQLGEDMTAWAKVYDAGGKALHRSSRTLGDMAELGRRMERTLEAGPPAAVVQMLRMMTGPFPGFAGPPSTPPVPGGPFAQLWDAWLSSVAPPAPAAKDQQK